MLISNTRVFVSPNTDDGKGTWVEGGDTHALSIDTAGLASASWKQATRATITRAHRIQLRILLFELKKREKKNNEIKKGRIMGNFPSS